MRSCIFSIITPVFSVTWPSEIIIIYWFAAQDVFWILLITVVLHNIVVYVHIHRYFGLVSRLTSLTVLFVLLNAICLKRPDTSPDWWWWWWWCKVVWGALLTQVKHGGDEAPADDELAALEHLLQPLLALFAQFAHDFTRFDQRSSLDAMRSAEGRGRAQEARVCRKVCGGGYSFATVTKEAPRGHLVATHQCRKYLFNL